MAKFFKFTEKTATSFLKILDLSPSSVSELAKLLGSKLETLRDKSGQLAAANTLKSISVDLAMELLDTVIPLCFGQVSRGDPLEEIVAGVARSIQNVYPDSLSTASKQREFKRRLTTLLQSDDLALKAKAFRLMTDNANTLMSSSIVSDIRPIFSASRADKIAAAVVVHNLKLAYMGSTEREEIYLALDIVDLKELEEVVQRAIKKEKALAKLIADSNLIHIKPE